MKRELTGDRNTCPSCGLHFNSSKAFDKHRTGRFGIDRRCLTIPQMEDKGMSSNRDGFWITEKLVTDSILSLRQTTNQPISWGEHVEDTSHLLDEKVLPKPELPSVCYSFP